MYTKFFHIVGDDFIIYDYIVNTSLLCFTNKREGKMKNYQEDIANIILRDMLTSFKSINCLNKFLNMNSNGFNAINLNDVSFLMAIKENPGVTQYDLAKYFNTTTQRVSYSIKKLIQIGYIEFKLIIKNKKEMKLLFLKDEGIKLLEELERYILKDTLDQLNENESMLILSFLKKYENFYRSFLSKLDKKS